MFSFLAQKKADTALGIEKTAEGIRYALMELGSEQKVLYQGTDCPAVFFDVFGIATDRVLEYPLALRNVGDEEMQELLLNEMQTVWELDPKNFQVTYYRENKKSQDVLVGVLDNESYFQCQNFAREFKGNFNALVPMRPKDTDEYASAKHAALVAADKEQDINFLDIKHFQERKKLRSQKYLYAARGIGILTILSFTALFGLFGFSYYRYYTLSKALGTMGELSARYDDSLEKNRQILALERDIKKIFSSHKFRTQQVEEILDAMPEYGNEISVLKTERTRENQKIIEKILLEGKAQDLRQVKKFVNTLLENKSFSKVFVSAGKNLEDGSSGYTITIYNGEQRP